MMSDLGSTALANVKESVYRSTVNSMYGHRARGDRPMPYDTMRLTCTSWQRLNPFAMRSLG